MDPDAELMMRVKNGDDSSFGALITRYRKPLVNFVFRIVKDASAADDIAQDVFVNIYLARDRYVATARFSTWLFTVATNMSFKWLKRNKRYVYEAEGRSESGRLFAGFREIGRDALGRILDDELAGLVRQAVQELPEKERTAIVLCKYHDFSYQEIASIMKCSLGAIKTYIHRGKLRLQTIFRRSGHPVDGLTVDREG